MRPFGQVVAACVRVAVQGAVAARAALMFSIAMLAGCTSVYNQPVNEPLLAGASIESGSETIPYEDELLIALSFSGGGTRAAAFSFGVLEEMHSARLRGSGSLLDRVDFVSGVSGGSVTAAYFGLKRSAIVDDFRERFLLRDAEAALRTQLSIDNLSRALSGGVNDATGFTHWLDQNLFGGATFAEFRARRRPRIWINASDIYNRTSFVFGQTAFSAMCSDLDSYPIADAVAASAAVPVVFAPVVIKTYAGACNRPLPEWIVRARQNPAAAPMLKAFANAIASYHDGTTPYIKLLDGGLVDNYGLSGFTIARLSSTTPYGPLTPRQAVKIRRVLTLVVDAGRGPSGNWTHTVEGPSGPELVVAAADTAMVASVQASYTAFNSTMGEWQSSLIRWRCGLSAAERKRLGAPANFNCRDVKFFVGRVGFDQLDPARAAELDAVRTSFRLPPDTVDSVISAGRDALRANPTYSAFLKSL
jgi:NTE family protein